MSSRRRPRSLSLACCVLALTALGACKDKDKEPSTDPLELIPADMHGVFGRSAADAPGLVVGPTGLEFRTMKLTIHEGKMEGSTVRVERATLQWEKLEPKTCTGTISRQGKHLLMSLFDANHPEDKCESILDDKWSQWVELESIPEPMRGRYGVLLVEDKSMRLDIDWLTSSLETGTIWQLPGTNDERVELLVDMAKVTREGTEGGGTESFMCDGELKLADNRLEAHFFLPPSLEPAPGSDEAKDEELQRKLDVNRSACEDWQGTAQKFVVSLDNLPQTPLRAGEVEITIAPDKVVLDAPGMRCEQELWKTESVESRAGWSGAQFGGEQMTLGLAAPTGVSDDCKLNIRIFCEGQDGVDSRDIDTEAEPNDFVTACMAETEHNLCPESLTVREISDTRYKVHAEPRLFNIVACVDVNPEFEI